MQADSELEEGCYHSLNWVMAGKAKQKWGAVKQVSNPHVRVKDKVVCLSDVECSYLPRGTYTNCRGVTLHHQKNQTRFNSQHMRTCFPKRGGNKPYDPQLSLEIATGI